MVSGCKSRRAHIRSLSTVRGFLQRKKGEGKRRERRGSEKKMERGLPHMLDLQGDPVVAHHSTINPVILTPLLHIHKSSTNKAFNKKRQRETV